MNVKAKKLAWCFSAMKSWKNKIRRPFCDIVTGVEHLFCMMMSEETNTSRGKARLKAFILWWEIPVEAVIKRRPWMIHVGWNFHRGLDSMSSHCCSSSSQQTNANSQPVLTSDSRHEKFFNRKLNPFIIQTNVIFTFVTFCWLSSFVLLMQVVVILCLYGASGAESTGVRSKRDEGTKYWTDTERK
jgi:hypothetical protein